MSMGQLFGKSVACVTQFDNFCDFLAFLVTSYINSAAQLLYKVFSELILPIPAELEYLRTPDDIDGNDQSVPMMSVNPESSVLLVPGSTATRSSDNHYDISRPK